MKTDLRTQPVNFSGNKSSPRYLLILGVPVRWTTPVQLWALTGLIASMTILFYFAAQSAFTRSNAALKIIKKDCAPSIVAAQHLRLALADFDANTSNKLISDTDSEDMSRAIKEAAARHKQISEKLVDAARNITFVDKEVEPITTIVNDLGAYESLMSRAQSLLEKKDKEGAIKAAREATTLIHGNLIPAADRLDAANSSQLKITYNDSRSHSALSLSGLIISGLLLLASLVVAQIFLTLKTKRRLNPALLAATLATLFYGFSAATALLQSSSSLRLGVEDAFASVQYLLKARAVSYDANGEETRWLYDRQNRIEYSKNFTAKTKLIVDLPNSYTFQKIATLAKDPKQLPSGFTGYMADELRNITFIEDGEGEAAIAALLAYSDYLTVDTEIRKLENDNRHEAAIALCLSYSPGGSNYVFGQFDKKLEKLIAINQNQFDRAMNGAINTLAPFNWMTPALIIFLVGLTATGFWPRINEYGA